MNLEETLAQGIPHAEAADYFIRLRGRDKLAALSPVDFEAGLAELSSEERAELIKGATASHLAASTAGAVKRAQMAPMPAPALPATGMGKNVVEATPPPLPATGLGQNAKMAGLSEKHEDEAGRSRGRAATAAHFEREKHRQHERREEFGGRAVGGVAGGAASRAFKKKHPFTTLASVALGSHFGGKAGKRLGQSFDKKEWEKKHAEAFKLALDAAGMTGGAPQPAAPAVGQPPGAPPAPQEQPHGVEPLLDPETQAYLEQEQAGEAEAEQMHADMLRQKLQEAQAELQMAQQTAQSAQEQQASHDQQLQTMQQQIADATTRSTQAQDQVLQNQQAASAMRMAFQQLRGQVLQLAASDPPMMSSDAQALLASQQPPTQPSPDGQPPVQQGPANQAGAPGTAPGAAPPSGEADANQPAAGGATGPETAAATGEKGEKEQPSGGGDNKGSESKSVALKVGHASRALKEAAAELLPFVGRGKTAALKDFFASQASKALAVLPHAAVGGVIGAGLGAGEVYTSNEPLRQKVQGLEAKKDRGFGDTMSLAQAKARLTIGEFAAEHPKTMMGMGALGGALIGAAEGPGLVSSVRRSGEHVGNIARHVKTLMKGAA
jgi:hypothetical protein